MTVAIGSRSGVSARGVGCSPRAPPGRRAGVISYNQRMNKAFTRESDGDSEVGLEDEIEKAPEIPTGARNYMTPGGFARLKAELDHLVDRERPEVVAVVSWAAGNGDRSENGDYIYGKKRLRE